MLEFSFNYKYFPTFQINKREVHFNSLFFVLIKYLISKVLLRFVLDLCEAFNWNFSDTPRAHFKHQVKSLPLSFN